LKKFQTYPLKKEMKTLTI